MLWRLLKFFLFKMDPEKAHYFSMDLFSFVLRIPILSSVVKHSFRHQKRQESVSLFGLQFNNRVGLAAGFDKDGKWLDILQFMGFGFIVSRIGWLKKPLLNLWLDDDLLWSTKNL